MARKRKFPALPFLPVVADSRGLAADRRRILDEHVHTDAIQHGRKLRTDRLREAVFAVEECRARGLNGTGLIDAAARQLVEMKLPAQVQVQGPARPNPENDESIVHRLRDHAVQTGDKQLIRSIDDSLERIARTGRATLSRGEHLTLENARRIVRQVQAMTLVQ
jgi:hypothetical protein